MSESASSRSVLLLSGGPDSATLTAWARANGHDDLHTVYLRTGHIHDDPAIECADSISAKAGATLEIIDVGHLVRALGSRELLIHSQANIMPFGNAIALSIAVTYAKQIQAEYILVGVHKDDADESPEYQRPFFDALEALAQSTQGDIRVLTPFIEMTKSEVFTLGAELGVDYSKTWSCIRAGDLHCGYCGACRARARALQAIGQQDRTTYERPVVALASAASH